MARPWKASLSSSRHSKKYSVISTSCLVFRNTGRSPIGGCDGDRSLDARQASESLMVSECSLPFRFLLGASYGTKVVFSRHDLNSTSATDAGSITRGGEGQSRGVARLEQGCAVGYLDRAMGRDETNGIRDHSETGVGWREALTGLRVAASMVDMCRATIATHDGFDKAIFLIKVRDEGGIAANPASVDGIGNVDDECRFF